jgi:hypothetical protein
LEREYWAELLILYFRVVCQRWLVSNDKRLNASHEWGCGVLHSGTAPA